MHFSKESKIYYTRVLTSNPIHINLPSYGRTTILLALNICREFGFEINISLNGTAIPVRRRSLAALILQLFIM